MNNDVIIRRMVLCDVDAVRAIETASFAKPWSRADFVNKMEIALKESSRKIERFKENVEANSSLVVPKWLSFDANSLTGKVVAAPTREDIDFPVEEHLIIELYSK